MTGMTWSGSLDFARVAAAIEAASEHGARLGGELVLGESQKVVPIEEGTLQRSGRVDVEDHGSTTVAAISYSGPYAVVQHERLDYRHDAGRTAKYLERPLTSAGPKVAQIIAQAIRQALP